MSSYPVQILPAPKQYGFMPGLAEGFGNAAPQVANIYGQSMVKDLLEKKKKAKDTKELNAYRAWAKENNVPIEESMTYNTKSGISRTLKPKSTNISNLPKAIEETIAGVRSPETVGQYFGIKKDEPAMSLASGGEGTINEMPVQDYGEKVRNAMMGKFAPGMTQNDVIKKVMGFKNTSSSSSNNKGFGKRSDGTEKGMGYFGVLNRNGGGVSSELSIGVDLDGKETEIPALVPTLNRYEIDYLLSGGKPTKTIVEKAVEHAKKRIGEGKSPFADDGEQYSLPKKEKRAIDSISKSENFIEGTGSPISRIKSFMSPSQAELTEPTKKVISNIKSQADLEELIMNEAEYTAQGVDVKAIKEYFGKK